MVMPGFVFWSLMMRGFPRCLGVLAPKLLRSLEAHNGEHPAGAYARRVAVGVRQFGPTLPKAQQFLPETTLRVMLLADLLRGDGPDAPLPFGLKGQQDGRRGNGSR
jgi:hypothetical protein